MYSIICRIAVGMLQLYIYTIYVRGVREKKNAEYQLLLISYLEKQLHILSATYMCIVESSDIDIP